MCEAISATTAFYISTALTVASQAASYMAQQQQANAQAKYQQAMADANAKQMQENADIANKAYLNKVEGEHQRIIQEQQKTTQDMTNVEVQAAQKMAQARVSAGESGVSGLSVDSLLNDYGRQLAAYRDAAGQNLESATRQSQNNVEGYRAQALGQIASVQPYVAQPVNQPSPFNAVLGMGAGTFDNFMKYSKVDPNTGKRTLG